MHALRHILLQRQPEGGLRVQRLLLVSTEAGQTEMPAACRGQAVPATPAARLLLICTERTQCSQAHRWHFKWGPVSWEKCRKVKPGPQTAPFCLTRLCSWVQRIKSTNRPWFGFMQRRLLISTVWSLGRPQTSLSTQLYCLSRSFQEKCVLMWP